MSIHQKLFKIQQEAVAPKVKENSFGGFRYRNVETILQMIKPTLRRNLCYVQLSDYAVEINGATYIKAKATMYDAETGESISSEAYAREMDSKKGMDSSQCTGSASTYARKYALCGLLGLDDSKAKAASDPDSDTPQAHEESKDIERQEILGKIYDMDITRKEVDEQIAIYYKGKNADTLDIRNLKALYKYYQTERRK